MYALECAGKGCDVKIILEGPATARLRMLAKDAKFSELFKRAKNAKLIEGICRTAAKGCSTGIKARNVTMIAKREGLKLISELDGHAGIARFISLGYQVLIF